MKFFATFAENINFQYSSTMKRILLLIVLAFLSSALVLAQETFSYGGDVNIIINIMLGKAQASSYPGNADLNGDNKVDVSDVNIVINIMLGKE